ncbi:MAG: hypothetical protein HC830_01610, partial [Bacteroidetes bacterium]|nr:hypothetical protein [Bacteroidota bacterium]
MRKKYFERTTSLDEGRFWLESFLVDDKRVLNMASIPSLSTGFSMELARK